jgi:hypothetical protein
MMVRRRRHNVPCSSNAIVYTEQEVTQLYKKAEEAFMRFEYLHHLLSYVEQRHQGTLATRIGRCALRMDRSRPRNDTCKSVLACATTHFTLHRVGSTTLFRLSKLRASSLNAPRLSDEKRVG